MKVSVIMPAYNRERFIGAAIRSLLRQKMDADLDIIVVDDGSTDATAEIVADISAGDPAVRLVQQPNAGVARARNTGLDHIHDKAELVTFLDSDDASVMPRFALELPMFQEDPKLAMTYALMTLTEDIDENSFVPSSGAATCTMRGIGLMAAMFRRSAVEQVGRFDETLRQSEDLDFLLRFFESPLKYRLVDHVAVLYRKHPDGITKDREEARKFFLKSLLLSARRRRLAGRNQKIPKFFDIEQLLEVKNAPLR